MSSTRATKSRPEGLVKMSALAKLSGVPAATIKHYVREGLLPAPAHTSRNMAYYAPSLVPRIQRIKHLQRTRFLPLKVIRRVLDEDVAGDPDETLSATLARVLEPPNEGDFRTRAELERAGVSREDLSFLVALGIVHPRRVGRRSGFGGDDLEILRVLGAARKAGLTPAMLPLSILKEYAAALRALVRVELRLFREGVLATAAGDVAELTESAAVLSERLVLLMRRRLLLPTLESLRAEERAKRKR